VGLTGLPAVMVMIVPMGRLVTIPILFIVKARVPIRVHVVIIVSVFVQVGALRELREGKGTASAHIGLSVGFCDSAEVKDESGDRGAD
jgi:hypothetical protein